MSEFRQFLAIANGRFPGQGRVAQEAKRDGGDIPFGLDYAENFILGHLKMEGALIVLREMIAPAAQRIGEVGERGDRVRVVVAYSRAPANEKETPLEARRGRRSPSVRCWILLACSRRGSASPYRPSAW